MWNVINDVLGHLSFPQAQRRCKITKEGKGKSTKLAAAKILSTAIELRALHNPIDQCAESGRTGFRGGEVKRGDAPANSALWSVSLLLPWALALALISSHLDLSSLEDLALMGAAVNQIMCIKEVTVCFTLPEISFCVTARAQRSALHSIHTTPAQLLSENTGHSVLPSVGSSILNLSHLNATHAYENSLSLAKNRQFDEYKPKAMMLI